MCTWTADLCTAQIAILWPFSNAGFRIPPLPPHLSLHAVLQARCAVWGTKWRAEHGPSLSRHAATWNHTAYCYRPRPLPCGDPHDRAQRHLGPGQGEAGQWWGRDGGRLRFIHVWAPIWSLFLKLLNSYQAFPPQTQSTPAPCMTYRLPCSLYAWINHIPRLPQLRPPSETPTLKFWPKGVSMATAHSRTAATDGPTVPHRLDGILI